MNDTHKLLLAFIEASGFEVTTEDVVTYGPEYEDSKFLTNTTGIECLKELSKHSSLYRRVFRETKFTVTKKEAEPTIGATPALGFAPMMLPRGR